MKWKKILHFIILIIFMLAMIIGINIYFDSKRDLTREEFITKAREIVLATEIDITQKVYVGSYTYTVKDQIVENLEQKFKGLKDIEGTIVYDTIGESTYALHTSKWCIKKPFKQEEEVTSYEEETCTIEDINPQEEIHVELVEKNSVSFQVKVVNSQNKSFSHFEIMINNGEWIPSEKEIFTYEIEKSGNFEVKAKIIDSYNQEFISEPLTITIEREKLINHIQNQVATPQDTVKSNNGKLINLGEYGIRYQGNNPNNYVQWNSETWRIIGIVDGKVKLIKNDSVGKYTWSDSDNNWVNSNLQKYLNNDFYQSLKNKEFIDTKASWYLKGYNVDMNKTQVYTYERGEGVTIGDNPAILPNNDVDLYPVGLMYASDYGFAAEESTTCLSTTTLATYASCMNTNWLSGLDEWTLTTSSYGYAFIASVSGWVSPWGYITAKQDVRPAVYLKEDVKIISGDGSENNKYVLVLE